MNHRLSKVVGDSLGMRTLGRLPEPSAGLRGASSTCRRAQGGSLRFEDKFSNVAPLHCQTSTSGRNPPHQCSPVCTTKGSPILLGVNHSNVRNRAVELY